MSQTVEFDPRSWRKGRPTRRLRYLILLLELRADGEMLNQLGKSVRQYVDEPERANGPLLSIELDLVAQRVEAIVVRMEKGFSEMATLEVERLAEDAYRNDYAGRLVVSPDDFASLSAVVRRVVVEGWRPFVYDPETGFVHPNPDSES